MACTKTPESRIPFIYLFNVLIIFSEESLWLVLPFGNVTGSGQFSKIPCDRTWGRLS